jgi:hypothetical protein
VKKESETVVTLEFAEGTFGETGTLTIIKQITKINQINIKTNALNFEMM